MSTVVPNRPAVASDDYTEFCEFVRGLCGIDLSQYKRPQMERRLRAFYTRRGIDDLKQACRLLDSDDSHLDEFLDRITINVSQLWRNPEQWRLMERKLLPELAAEGQVRAWSAGCSYGAEAYTLAALCHVVCNGIRVRIQGTDIDRRMVGRARHGVFTSADARSAPERQLKLGFEAVEGGWRARPELRAMTSFEVADLLKLRPRPRSYDLVLCRNTVIYFSEPIRDELHARLAESLRPGGYLMVGSTERVSAPAALGLSSQHPFIYRKA